MNRRTKITVEAHQVVLVSDFDPVETLWYGLCGEETRWLRPERAAVLVIIDLNNVAARHKLQITCVRVATPR